MKFTHFFAIIAMTCQDLRCRRNFVALAVQKEDKEDYIYSDGGNKTVFCPHCERYSTINNILFGKGIKVVPLTKHELNDVMKTMEQAVTSHKEDKKNVSDDKSALSIELNLDIQKKSLPKKIKRSEWTKDPSSLICPDCSSSLIERKSHSGVSFLCCPLTRKDDTSGLHRRTVTIING